MIVIHSHELHPPALPRKYNEFSHNKIQGNRGGDKLSECEGGMYGEDVEMFFFQPTRNDFLEIISSND